MHVVVTKKKCTFGHDTFEKGEIFQVQNVTVGVSGKHYHVNGTHRIFLETEVDTYTGTQGTVVLKLGKLLRIMQANGGGNDLTYTKLRLADVRAGINLNEDDVRLLNNFHHIYKVSFYKKYEHSYHNAPNLLKYLTYLAASNHLGYELSYPQFKLLKGKPVENSTAGWTKKRKLLERMKVIRVERGKVMKSYGIGSQIRTYPGDEFWNYIELMKIKSKHMENWDMWWNECCVRINSFYLKKVKMYK